MVHILNIYLSSVLHVVTVYKFSMRKDFEFKSRSKFYCHPDVLARVIYTSFLGIIFYPTQEALQCVALALGGGSVWYRFSWKHDFYEGNVNRALSYGNYSNIVHLQTFFIFSNCLRRCSRLLLLGRKRTDWLYGLCNFVHLSDRFFSYSPEISMQVGFYFLRSGNTVKNLNTTEMSIRSPPISFHKFRYIIIRLFNIALIVLNLQFNWIQGRAKPWNKHLKRVFTMWKILKFATIQNNDNL